MCRKNAESFKRNIKNINKKLHKNNFNFLFQKRSSRIKLFLFIRYTIREQTLAEGMVSELGIERSIRQDTGIFICTATNSYGNDEMNIQLIVQEIPEPPRNVRIMDQLSRSIGVSWTQPYAGNSPITSYVVQYKLGSGKLN